MSENLFINTLNDFESISLNDMDSVILLNRLCVKFTFHISKLNQMLESIKNNYKILQIEKKRIFNYRTTYFDTNNYDLYMQHHNNKLNRCKIRFREYLDTNTSFLEVKLKTNKDRTIKKRIKIQDDIFSIKKKNDKFIRKNTSYRFSELKPKIITEFSRFTIVDIKAKERVTVDFNLNFLNTISDKALVTNERQHRLTKLVIMELKYDTENNSKLIDLLHSLNISPFGISKYCIGALLCERNIKYNRFKKNLLSLQKIENEYKFPFIN